MPKRKPELCPEIFWTYHKTIEVAIGIAAKRHSDNPKKFFAVVNNAVGACAFDLMRTMLNIKEARNPKLKGKFDECWLYLYAQSLILTVWSSAVARGKALDKKRDMKGRQGWLRKSFMLEWPYKYALDIGYEIANRSLFEEGDYDSTAYFELLTKLIENA